MSEEIDFDNFFDQLKDIRNRQIVISDEFVKFCLSEYGYSPTKLSHMTGHDLTVTWKACEKVMQAKIDEQEKEISELKNRVCKWKKVIPKHTITVTMYRQSCTNRESSMLPGSFCINCGGKIKYCLDDGHE
jgi:hypothetical protein